MGWGCRLRGLRDAATRVPVGEICGRCQNILVVDSLPVGLRVRNWNQAAV